MCFVQHSFTSFCDTEKQDQHQMKAHAPTLEGSTEITCHTTDHLPSQDAPDLDQHTEYWCVLSYEAHIIY